METLEVNKENAIKAYNDADDKTQALLVNLFGKKTFITDTTQLIKTFEDACEYLGIDAEDFKLSAAGDSPDEYAYKQLKIIVKALNGGEVMDYKDTSVYKYYPWFNSAGSCSGFSSYDFFCDDDYSTVGARLCFKTSALAKYAGTQFLNIYNNFIN